jgi:hypothetical protein
LKKKRHAVGRREIDEKNAREKERGRESRRKSQAAERPTTAASSKGFPLLSLSRLSLLQAAAAAAFELDLGRSSERH